MESGATRYVSKDFPALPESEQRTVASKISTAINIRINSSLDTTGKQKYGR